jgi:hypothetical protein
MVSSVVSCAGQRRAAFYVRHLNRPVTRPEVIAKSLGLKVLLAGQNR